MWNGKEGRENKSFKKDGGGKLGQGVDALKSGGGGGLEPPYKLWLYMMIADHDIWWLTKPDFWKKIWQPEFGSSGPKSGPKWSFSPFPSSLLP